MFGAGVVSGMFGIGSGILKVLALEGEMRLPMKVATATSNLMIGVTVTAGVGVLLTAAMSIPSWPPRWPSARRWDSSAAAGCCPGSVTGWSGGSSYPCSLP
jgi:uncharacterized membrane protein YfcA